MVSFFSLGGRNVFDRLQKAAVVESVEPFERGEVHGFEVAPWSSPMDDLGFVKTVDRFGESIVVTVADASDGRLDARLGQMDRTGAARHSQLYVDMSLCSP